MLVLIKWDDDETGGTFRTSFGQVVHKDMRELTNEYLPFTHISPKGEDKDIEIFIRKVNFPNA